MKQNNQEKYAEENFAGLDVIIKSIKYKMKEIDKFRKDYKAGKIDTTKIDADTEYEQLINHLELSFTMLSIRFTNTVGHALNSDTTGVLKKLIKFLNTNGLNDELLKTNMIKTISNKLNSGSFIDMCAISAMRNHDLTFIKELEIFFQNNKNRDNKYDNYARKYGIMDTSDMTRFTQTDAIAFEALLSGFKDGYIYFTKSQGLTKEYILKYIKNKMSLTEQDVRGILIVDPEYLDALLEFIPDKIPNDVKDIFIF